MPTFEQWLEDQDRSIDILHRDYQYDMYVDEVLSQYEGDDNGETTSITNEAGRIRGGSLQY